MADYDWLVTWDRQRGAIEPDALAAISAAVGGADPTQISAAVNDYLTANPPNPDTVTMTDAEISAALGA